MKKKLLLSSVAALTLFAAYNTASADTDDFGRNKSAEPVKPASERSADLLGAAKSPDQLRAEAAALSTRQNLVNAMRTKKVAFEGAVEAEKVAVKEYDEALEAYNKAVADLVEVKGKQKNAHILRQKLADLKAQYGTDKTEAQPKLAAVVALLGDKKDLTANPAVAASTGLYLAAETAQENYDRALVALKQQLAKEPLAGTSAEDVAHYEADKKEAQARVEATKASKEKADSELKDALAKKAEYKKVIENADKQMDTLAKAIEELDVVIVGAASTTAPTVANTGKIEDKAISTFETTVSNLRDALDTKLATKLEKMAATKDAKYDYEKAVTAAKAEYDKQGVAFNEATLSVSDTPTEAPVVTFGWSKDAKGNWTYVVNSKGETAKGWVNDNGTWYYLNAEGVMQTGWAKDNGTWYYLNGSGAMQTGWVQLDGTWYYLNGSGAMLTGWFEVNGKWYYANGSGALLVSTTTPDGYTVNENGEWV